MANVSEDKHVSYSGLKQILTKLKTWFVPLTRKVNNKVLSADITLSGNDIVSGQVASGNTVNQDLSALSGQIDYLEESVDNLLIAEFDSSDGSIVFRSSDVALYDFTDGSITINV